jgi:pimeloyl-ACP methyl ester carboxylesterase
MKTILAAMLAMLLGACVTPAPPQPSGPGRIQVGFISEPRSGELMTPEGSAALLSGIQATMVDPPRHPTQPARNRQLVIPSGPVLPALGRPAEMNALMFVAAGPGPHPTLLLLHGLPGNERNLDLAQAVRRAGWNVLTFTYRGAWGSEGTFSIQHAVADTEAALDWLRSEAAARNFGVDRSRIVIGGHSMGGYMAAHVAARDDGQSGERLECQDICSPAAAVEAEARRAPPLAGVILLDAWDIGATARMVKAGGAQGRAGLVAELDDVGHALGSITAADLVDELILRGEQWDLAGLAPTLALFPTLTVYATHGGAQENKAVAAAIENACPSADIPTCAPFRKVELPTDHAFADHRLALAREVVGWLSGAPRATR